MTTPQEQVNARKRYKRRLRDIVSACPHGTRQRIAREIECTRSYVSQMLNPESTVPVPEKYLPSIMQVCEFQETEAAEFMGIYRLAHPEKSCKVVESGEDFIKISLPKFRTAEQRRHVVELILKSAESIVQVMSESGGSRPGR